MKTPAIWAIVSLSFMAGCNGGGTGDPPTAAGTGGAGTGGATSGTGGVSAGTGGASAGTGGATSVAGTGGASAGTGGATSGTGGGGTGTAGTGGAVVPDQTLCGAVSVTTLMTVAAGKTVAICAGSTLTIASDVGINVMGTLLVQGTATAPVRFVGVTHTPGSWGGFVLQAGGSLVATYFEVHDAGYAFNARAGSSFQIDHVLMDNSLQLLQLATNGTLSHGVLHGGASVMVTGASPTLSDTVLDKGLGSDIVIVSGAASKPVFDHLEVTDAHCAFHFNEGAGATISNSWIHGNAYGLMMGASVNNQITHNNFEGDQINIGTCAGAASAQVTGNYFVGQPFNDGSCPTLTATGTVTGPFTTDVGPRL